MADVALYSRAGQIACRPVKYITISSYGNVYFSFYGYHSSIFSKLEALKISERLGRVKTVALILPPFAFQYEASSLTCSIDRKSFEVF